MDPITVMDLQNVITEQAVELMRLRSLLASAEQTIRGLQAMLPPTDTAAEPTAAEGTAASSEGKAS